MNFTPSVTLQRTAGFVSLAAALAVLLCMPNSWVKYMIAVPLFFSGDFIVWKLERAAKGARQAGPQSGRFRI